ncbi:MAG: selenide, water dikinase SelD, partial [Bacteroidota bacterium]
GGHSIDSLEPIFGLSVNGLIQKNNLKKNNTAKAGNFIFLTKALGSGILSTAQKRGHLKDDDRQAWVKQLVTLNKFGALLGEKEYVTAITDITGFGLLGHLHEMTEGSKLSAELYYGAIPKMQGIEHYLGLNCIPDATYRNWNAYNAFVKIDEDVDQMQSFQLLPDPQTNGGLMFAVDENGLDNLMQLMKQNGLQEHCKAIGKFIPQSETLIRVKK